MPNLPSSLPPSYLDGILKAVDAHPLAAAMLLMTAVVIAALWAVIAVVGKR